MCLSALLLVIHTHEPPAFPRSTFPPPRVQARAIPRPVLNARHEAAFPVRFHADGRTKENAHAISLRAGLALGLPVSLLLGARLPNLGQSVYSWVLMRFSFLISDPFLLLVWVTVERARAFLDVWVGIVGPWEQSSPYGGSHLPRFLLFRIIDAIHRRGRFGRKGTGRFKHDATPARVAAGVELGAGAGGFSQRRLQIGD